MIRYKITPNGVKYDLLRRKKWYLPYKFVSYGYSIEKCLSIINDLHNPTDIISIKITV